MSPGRLASIGLYWIEWDTQRRPKWGMSDRRSWFIRIRIGKPAFLAPCLRGEVGMHRDSIGCKGASNRSTRFSGDTFPHREPQKGIYAASFTATCVLRARC